MDVRGNSLRWPCRPHFTTSQGEKRASPADTQPPIGVAVDKGGGRSLLCVTSSKLVSSSHPALCLPGQSFRMPQEVPRPGLQISSSLSPLSGIPPHRPVAAPSPQNCSSPPRTPGSDPLPLAPGRPRQPPAIADVSADRGCLCHFSPQITDVSVAPPRTAPR